MRSLVPFCLAIVVGLPGRSLYAQEVRALSEEIHQFSSPMVLEMSLDPLLDKPVGEKWSTDKAKVFACRGVTIESLEFRVQPKSEHKFTMVEVHAFLNNNSGKDKRTNIRFEGVDGVRVICAAVIQTTVEQGESDKHRTVLALVPPERWTQLPRPKLRVVVTLQDY